MPERTNCGPLQITVDVERPSRPTIWLDTLALINIVKAREGRPQSEIDRKRIQVLDGIVAEKVRAGRLLCLEGEQRHEVRTSGLNRVVDALESLSVGAKLRPLHTVRCFQWEVAMGAYLNGVNKIALPSRAFFDGDPTHAVDRNLEQGWALTVRMGEHDEARQHRRQKKGDLLLQLEQLRQAKVAEGTTFEQQLEREFEGTWEGIKALFARAMQPIGAGVPQFWDWMGALALAEVSAMWRSLGGEPMDLPKFFQSQYLRALPLEDIQSRIYADLLTGREPIESGDADDTDHLALVMPIASFVLTDKRMAKRVHDLGLDERWGTRVFSLSTTNDLAAALAVL